VVGEGEESVEDRILRNLKHLKEHGKVLGEELDRQNPMINNLNSEMDKANTKMNKVNHILKKELGK
jgi:hypothetical protein